MYFNFLTNQDWDFFIKKTDFPSVYLSSLWFDTLINCFGGEYKLVLCKLRDNDFIIPYFFGQPWSKEVRIGAIGYGGPICLKSGYCLKLSKILEITKLIFNKNCTNITGLPVINDNQYLENNNYSCTSVLSLSKHIDLFQDIYSGNVRTAVRKGFKSKINIVLLNENHLDEAIQLIHLTQRRVGAHYVTPPDLIYNIISSDLGGGLCAFYNDKLISVSIYLQNYFEFAYFLNGWNKDYGNFCPNQLLIHHMILKAQQLNCQIFNFGESAYESLKDSKARWGGEERKVFRWSQFN